MSTATTTAQTELHDCAGKYLTISLGGEAYGLSVLRIREIIRHQAITSVPQMPPHVKGVINLRGRVIPVVDLRLKFNLPADTSERTCIVVAQVTLGDRLTQMGVVVDSVEDVVTLAAADIEPVPEFGTRLDTSGLLGMAKVKGQVKTLLDLDRVLASDALVP